VKRRRKQVSDRRVPPRRSQRVNERWTMDFLADPLADGTRFRILTVVDTYSRSGVSSRGVLSGDLLSLVVKGSVLAFPGEGEDGAVAPYPVADSFIKPGGAETDDATFAIEVWLK
jgi:transposase InsO family protein